MKKMAMFFALTWLLPTVLLADVLRLQLPYNSRVGDTVTLRAFLQTSSGEVDVSQDVSFSSADLSSRGGNQYYVHLPHGPQYSSQYPITVSARYYGDNGSALSAQGSFWVDLTPDYIEIQGPWAVAVNSSQSYRAYGSYQGQRQDLTYSGRWSTNYGNVSQGMYYAPSVPGTASLSFTYGSKSQSLNIGIR